LFIENGLGIRAFKHSRSSLLLLFASLFFLIDERFDFGVDAKVA